jgi:valyl-tRNA synthetase
MEKLLLLLHPFMPFITEELWQHLKERGHGESIMMCPLPKASNFSEDVIEQFERLKEVVVFVRSVRAEKNLPVKQALELHVVSPTGAYDHTLDPVMVKLLNLSGVVPSKEKPSQAASQVIRSVEYYVPLEGSVDEEAELEKLKTELEYTLGFLDTVNKKLSNERFVQSAPAQVVETERKKQADAEAKIRAIRSRLENRE